MTDEHLRPPQADIDFALEVEKSVKPEEQELYLKCLGKPMSERTTPQELRDGCILTNMVFLVCRDSQTKCTFSPKKKKVNYLKKMKETE